MPLIGFGGAPFTLAAYAIEGGPSTNYARTKAFMYAQPAAWHQLCDRFATVMARLPARAGRGRRAGDPDLRFLGRRARRADYREFALPHTRRIFDALRDAGVPTIHFGVGTTAILAELADGRRRRHRRRLAPAARRGVDAIGLDRGIQGNLDPRACSVREDGCWPPPTTCCAAPAAAPGHIFNLGHGVLPETPLENVQALARHVHEATRRSA